MFEKIFAKNLFSWENLEYPIPKGVSQISGWNYDDNTSEGCGKSSVVNALCWTLFGKIPKDAKIDEVVREGAKGGLGTVLLTSQHKICRSRKPNDLWIESPDGTKTRGKDAKETQSLINKLIGLDFNAFCQTVYFAQNYPNKFISSSETEKAQILSEIQDLTIFDRARKKAHEQAKVVEGQLRVLEKETDLLEAEASKIESNIRLITQFIQKFETDKAIAQNSLEQKKEDLEEEIAELRREIEEKSEQKANLSEIEAQIAQLQGSLGELTTLLEGAKRAERELLRLKSSATNLERKLERLALSKQNNKEKIKRLKSSAPEHVRRISELEEDLNNPGNCPACGQKATPEMLKKHRRKIEKQIEAETDKLKELDRNIKDAENLIAELEEETAEVEKELKAVRRDIKDFGDIPEEGETRRKRAEIEESLRKLQREKTRQRDAEINLAVKKKELQDKNKLLAQVESELKRLKETNCDEDLKRLDELRLRRSETESALQAALADQKSKKELIDQLEILKIGFKEVKQYVFQSLLAELSVKSTRLAAELFEIPVKIEFVNEDGEGVSKIITTVTLDGKERGLGLLSGGQYSRVALAVNLALSDIVSQRRNNPINLLILDEPFQNLSLESMEKAVKLLKNRGQRVILIEHNDIIKQIVDNVFGIEYRDGISRAS